MSRIRVLPDILVRKIAAGEVIERPASVVKELMENAIDAGGRHVCVTIEDGGRSLIRVSDDGLGMTAEELALAVQPHATSKLHREEDLYHIESMGFRGEALASIGAVSQMRIVSRPVGSDEGSEIIVEAEDVRTSRAAGCPVGSTVEVRDLFFNVPARRKFLRQAGTETGHVSTQFSRIALARPDIGFELVNRGRTVHRLDVCGGRLERIGGLFGQELIDELLMLRRDEEPVGIEVYAGRPAGSRSNTNWQYTYVNGRFVRDRYVQHSIREAYRGLLDPNRAAVVFVFLTLDPALVDVNVHPTKIEVRWADSGMVHSQVLSSLREALQKANLTPDVDTSRAWRSRSELDPEERNRLQQSFADSLRQSASWKPSTRVSDAADAGDRGGGRFESAERHGPDDASPARSQSSTADSDSWRALYERRDDVLEARGPEQAVFEGELAGGKIRAIQLHNTYLVCETDDGLVIIDQHALHERVLYNHLKDRFTTGTLESQRLLLPETLTVSAEQRALAETHGDLLEKLGIEVSAFGHDALAIHATPSLLKDTDAVSFLADLLDKLSEHGEQPVSSEEVIHGILDMMACKAAVKAGDALTTDEIEALLRERDVIDKASSCPHGRPTTLRLTVKDLERQFKRT